MEPRRVKNPPPSSGASWAPGGPQVATKAVLRPPLGGSWAALGGSWGRLGAVLGRSWRLLGTSWASRGAPRRLRRRFRHHILGDIFGSLPREPEKVSLFGYFSCFSSSFWVAFLAFCCLPCACACFYQGRVRQRNHVRIIPLPRCDRLQHWEETLGRDHRHLVRKKR